MQEILSKKIIGSRIRSLRLQHSYSQEFIASKLRISRSNYSQIELGNQFPSFQSLSEIASIYSKTYDWLIHGKEGNIVNKGDPFIEQTHRLSPLHSEKTLLIDDHSEYIKFCRSLTFLESLPKFNLPSTIKRNDGNYRAFTIKRKALKYIYPGDIIIGKAIDNYEHLFSNQIYVIVTHNEILLCYLDSISIENQTLNCRNDQLLNSNFQIKAAQVLEIWEAFEKYSTQIQPIINELESAYNNFEALIKKLEEEVISLKNWNKTIS